MYRINYFNKSYQAVNISELSVRGFGLYYQRQDILRYYLIDRKWMILSYKNRHSCEIFTICSRGDFILFFSHNCVCFCLCNKDGKHMLQ